MSSLWAREMIALNLVKTYSIELAQQIQRTCDREGKCPATMEGWDVVEEYPTSRASAYVIDKIGRKAHLRYDSIGAREFELTVNYNSIAWFNFNGGVGRTLYASANGRRMDAK